MEDGMGLAFDWDLGTQLVLLQALLLLPLPHKLVQLLPRLVLLGHFLQQRKKKKKKEREGQPRS